MKKYIKILLPMVLLVIVLVGAFFGYRQLSKNYESEQTKQNSENKSGSQAALENDEVSSSESADMDSTKQQAVDFSILDESGNNVQLSDYFGKPVVLNFWATWCGPCQSEMPYFNEMYAQYKDDINFVMVNLTDGSRDTVESVTKFKEEQKFDFPIFFDTKNEGGYAYNVMSIPMTFFIREDGTIASYQIGALSEKILKQQLEDLLE